MSSSSTLLSRTLTAGILAVGMGLAVLTIGAPASADSDIGRGNGGPLLEAEPVTPSERLEPIIPFNPSALPMPQEQPEASEKPRRPDGGPGGYEATEACPDADCTDRGGEGRPSMDGCVTETPCGPEDEWTDAGGGCFFLNSDYTQVYCPDYLHPLPVNDDGCFMKNDHFYCPEVPTPGEGGSPEPCEPVEGQVVCPEDPACPITHVSAECRPGDTPGDKPSDEPGDEPEDTPGTPPARAGGKPGLPVTGPSLVLLAVGGAVLAAVGGGGLLLARRRGQRTQDPLD